MRAFYAFPPPRFRIVPANPCPPHRATRSTDLLNVRCQPHSQRRTLRAHATASSRQNWDNQRWSFQSGGRCPILSTPVAPSLVHQRHSFTLTDLPPAWCNSCGCLREVRLGSDQPHLPPEGEKARLVVSVSAPFSNEEDGSREALPTWPDVRKGSTTIHHVVGPIDRGGDLHHRSVDSCAVAIWQIP